MEDNNMNIQLLKSINALLFTLVISSLLLPMFASAEPYLAQRYGLKCSACHSNVTGGGKRNEVGNGYAQGLTSSPISSLLTTTFSNGLSFGGNFRADWTHKQFDQPEADDNGIVAASIEDSSVFDINYGTLYLEFAMGDKLSFYLDQQVAPEGGRTREAMAIYRDLFNQGSYIKVGKFFLPYGLRLQDDQAFIRQSSGFNFDKSDTGLELGLESGPWSMALALTNGTQGAGENNTDKQVSMVASYIQPTYRFGLSATKNNGPNGFSRQGFNVFGGLTLGDWVLLWELDRFKDSSATNDTEQLMSFVSVNYLFSPSLNLKLSYDYLDPNEDIDEDEQIRVSLVGEKFINQYLQLRSGIRVYEGIPQNPLQNHDVLFIEAHVFF
jgi:hypothetical protein